MSSQIKIFMVVGALLIVAVVGYLLWPVGEEEAPQRGVSLENVDTGDSEEE